MTDQDNKHITGLINYLDYNVNTLPIRNISNGDQCGYLQDSVELFTFRVNKFS